MKRQVPLLILLLTPIVSVTHSATVYSLEAGAYPTESEAKARQEKLQQQMGPVVVREMTESKSVRYEVLVGEFATESRAWVYRAKSDDRVTSGWRIVKWESQETFLPPPQLPVEKPFNLEKLPVRAGATSATLTTSLADYQASHTVSALLTAVGLGVGVAPTDTLLAKPAAQMTKDELFSVGRDATSDVAVPALERFLSEYPNDAAANSARIRLARRLMARREFDRVEALFERVKATGSYEQKYLAALFQVYGRSRRDGQAASLEQYRALANDAAAPPGVRWDAMRRVAGTAHAIKDYPTAWLAFEQIAETSPDPAAAAEARMGLAGLAFELTGRGKGQWDEVRQYCDEVTSDPNAPRNVRATAALMHLETRFNETAYEQMLKEIEKLLASYSDSVRETSMALIWKGIGLIRLDRLAESEEVFKTLLRMEIPDNEKFANKEPHAKAAYWLAWLAMQKRDNAARDQHLRYLRDNYPNTRDWRDAQKLYAEKVITALGDSPSTQTVSNP